jgi:hypothetical protein
MTLIETKTLGADAASIEFTSIPQDGTDLVLYVSLRTNRASAVADEGIVDFNGLTTNQTHRTLYGEGSSASSFAESRMYIYGLPSTDATGNTFGNVSIHIPNYSGATNKSSSVDAVTENNATTAIQGLQAFLWSSTAAITSITISPRIGSQLVAGSTISLYKITKGSDGIVTTS